MLLSVNIDHTATLREARKGNEPDPVMSATLAILGGADGITLHLREDRRHVNDRDLALLREIVRCELNLEMASTEEMLQIALKTNPDLITIVPEKRLELTTEGGMDLSFKRDYLCDFVKKLKNKGLVVSVFINPVIEDLNIAKEIGFDMVEFHTGFYADSRGKEQEQALINIIKAVEEAGKIGMLANAGHGLNYFNVSRIASIPGIRGLYIGHSIISRAVLIGIEKAVRDMKSLIKFS
ncbi:MAG TPA: pyridoxine 5'-phosphate synthase [Nitrospirae bacterium]|nr:pyridoxine 5'-phosphate synthase [Nitrospirota bacterium]